MNISQALHIAAISLCFSLSVEAETTNLQAVELNNQAVMDIKAERLDQAEKLLLRAVDHWGTQGSPHSAAAHNNLAQVYKLKNQYGAADSQYRQAIEIWQTTHSAKLPYGLMNLADLYRVQGKLSGAAKLLERAVALFDAGSAPSLDASNRLAEVYLHLGRSVEASRLRHGVTSNSLLESNFR